MDVAIRFIPIPSFCPWCLLVRPLRRIAGLGPNVAVAIRTGRPGRTHARPRKARNEWGKPRQSPRDGTAGERIDAPVNAPSTARSRLQAARLYLVTPAAPFAGPLDDFLPRVLEAGVDVVQLREKDMEA